VSPDIVGDRGDGECEEFITALGIAAVDCVEQRGRPDLRQILVRGAGSAAAGGEGLYERLVQLRQSVACSTVAFLAVRDEEASGGRLALAACGMSRRKLLVRLGTSLTPP
jgi:hypothetical protein